MGTLRITKTIVMIVSVCVGIVYLPCLIGCMCQQWSVEISDPSLCFSFYITAIN